MLKPLPSTNIGSYSKQFSWLVRLRWCALFGLVSLVVFADLYLDISLPVAELWFLLVATALSNLFLQFARLSGTSFQRPLVAAAMVLDVFLLTAFLYLSGGPSNPFSILYLINVSVAALLLGAGWTWIIAILSMAGFGILFKFHTVIPELEMHHGHGAGFSAHLQGMLIAFILVAVLLSYFLTRMSAALVEQEREITDLKLLASQQERLASLTTLAAGAAHELGSPLGSIAIAVRELERQLEGGVIAVDAVEDVHFIASEVQRCRAILNKMGGDAGELQGEMPHRFTGQELKEAIQKELGHRQGDVSFTVPHDATFIAPQRNLVQVLLSLIRNALDASSQTPVTVQLHPGEVQHQFVVEDRGAGMSEELLRRIGEPFFSTKEPGQGMGLGIFLAKLFAKNIGGEIQFHSEEKRGTKVILSVPGHVTA